MTIAASGYEYPQVVGDLDHQTVDTIYDVCPGVHVEGLPEHLEDGGTHRDPVWGSYRRMVRAYAADPAVRFRAATGGALTALMLFLVETGRIAFALHAKASTTHPTFGERHLSFEPADVIEGAGSRYGPTATLVDVADILDRGAPFAFCGKPCDIAALRNVARHDPRVDDLVKYWLTPVCGGFLPPSSMRNFLATLGIDPEDLTALSYRGNGCPGPTRIETRDGRIIDKNYLDMWGDSEASWSLPFRCKICPDGIGEAADIAAADTWPGGSPTREGQDHDQGTNAVVARTEAGSELLQAAETAGYLSVEKKIGPEDMSLYQPHQVAKKLAAWARHVGLRSAGKLTPETKRLRIRQLAKGNGVSVNLAQARGTRQRARRSQD